MSAYDQPRFLPAGDRAVTVELAAEISPEINARVRALSRRLAQEPPPGIVDLVPTYRSLLVYFDPSRTGIADLKVRILAMAARNDVPADAPKVLQIPVVYGGEYGPDIEFVARHAGLSAAEVVEIHAGTNYLVYMMGFNTGFPYLGGMSAKIAAPRLHAPRTRIPAGSVGIAQQQTGIYPVDSPGGWQIIGRSPVRLFDPHRDPPVAIEAGDFIRFVAIDAAQYTAIEQLVQSNSYHDVVTETS
ncbi:5-oxoprolinase subunit PxpB [soil metagenome]